MTSVVSRESLGSECVGRVIDGRFVLRRWLGGTDQSSVFLTEIKGDPPRKAAIKLLPADATDAEACLAQWKAAETLSHPHLLRIFSAGRCAVDGQDHLFVVTEYAEEVLSEILAGRALSPEETREMMGPVLEALEYLHGQDLVHGHLKPANVMVVDECLKISADRLHANGEFGSRTHSTSPYDAPEFVTGILSPAADMWSLGALIIEALTQQPLAWDRRQGGEPVVPGYLPMPFFGIARECLQLDPARRLSLPGVRAALENPAGRKMAGPPAAASAGLPSKARIALLVGGVVVIGGAIAALEVSSHHGQSAPVAVTQEAAPQTPESQPETQTQAAQPQTEPQQQDLSKAAPRENTNPPKPAAVQPEPQRPEAQPAPSTAKPQAEAAPRPAPEEVPNQSAGAEGKVTTRVTPDVPQHILNTIQGHVRVRVRVQVGADGRVSDASLEDAGPSKYFAEKALDAARKWTFTPAQAASTWMLHFSFGREATTVTPQETSR